MGIHAMSLAALADRLEGGNRTQRNSIQPFEVRKGLFDLAELLPDLSKIAGREDREEDKPAAQLKFDYPAHVESSDLDVDSSFGFRTRASERRAMRKEEAAILLYPGFTSRSGITGE